MPDQGRAVISPSGNTPYDGKRALAKLQIGMILQGRGVKLDGVLDPAQLVIPAATLELALIYRDMASLGQNVASEKANYYYGMFERSMDLIEIDYEEPNQDPADHPTTTAVFGMIPLRRA